jgi:putative ABC transport system substrate-binding protein
VLFGPGKPSAPISVRIREAFLQGLREDGYIEGHNIAIEHRYAEDSDEASKAANEFVGLRVDVIIVVGTLAALAAKRATSSIPIVGLNMADPVADGLVASLSRPGGNVTGNTFIGPVLGSKRSPESPGSIGATTDHTTLRICGRVCLGIRFATRFSRDKL